MWKNLLPVLFMIHDRRLVLGIALLVTTLMVISSLSPAIYSNLSGTSPVTGLDGRAESYTAPTATPIKNTGDIDSTASSASVAALSGASSNTDSLQTGGPYLGAFTPSPQPSPPRLDPNPDSYAMFEGSGSSNTPVTISTSDTNDIIYAVAYTDSGTATLSIQDLAGLTWNIRDQASSFLSGGTECSLSSFWAVSPEVLTNDIIQFASSTPQPVVGMAFAVSGANTASPFDPDFPQYNLPSDTNNGAESMFFVSTANADDLIIGAIGMTGVSAIEPGFTGNTYGFNLLENYEGSALSSEIEYQSVSSTQNNLQVGFTLDSTLTSYPYFDIGDAFTSQGFQFSSNSFSISPNTGDSDVGQSLSVTMESGGFGEGTLWESTSSAFSSAESLGSMLVESGSISGVSGSLTKTSSQDATFTLSSPISIGTWYFEITGSTASPGNSVYSNAATTIVSADPTVSVAPDGPVDIAPGHSFSLTETVTYSGSNTASVEWYSSTSDSTTGGTSTGFAGITYTPSASTPGTTYYYAVVTDSGVPGYSYASNIVEVTVHPVIRHYSNTITEIGLPSGTMWGIHINSKNYTSNTSSITMDLRSGQYSYTVLNVTGYSASPSSGVLTVYNKAISINITFTPIMQSGYLIASLGQSNGSILVNGHLYYQSNNGSFNISLHPGTYEVVVYLSGSRAYTTNVTISSSAATPLAIRSHVTTHGFVDFWQTVMTVLIIVAFAMAALTTGAIIKSRRKE